MDEDTTCPHCGHDLDYDPDPDQPAFEEKAYCVGCDHLFFILTEASEA